MWFLKVCLNLLHVVHVFISSLQLFHRLTPFVVIQWSFALVLTNCFLNIHLPLKSYLLSLLWNNLWMLFGNCWFISLYMIWIVLKSTRSLNFSAFSLMKSLLVCWFSVSGFIYDSYGSLLEDDNWICVCFVCVPPHVHTVGNVWEYEGTVQGV